MNRFVRRISDASSRRPRRTLAVWAVLVAVVVALAGGFGGAFTDNFAAPGSDSAKAMDLLEERFPAEAGGSAVLVFAADEGQSLTEARSAVTSAIAAAGKVNHVASVADPFVAGTVSADGRIGYADVSLNVPATKFGREAAADVYDALAPARAAGLTAEFGGEAAFLNGEQASGAEGIGVLVALVILVVVFGTVVAALVPIALALVAVAAGISGIALLAASMDVSTAAPTFAAMLGLGVGIDYALFIVSRYREKRAAGEADAVALSDAMASSGTAVFFAGMTVVLSMAALTLTGVGFIASIGLASSIMVLVAVTAAVTLLPALLTLLGRRIDAWRVVGRRRVPKAAEQTAWWRLAHRIAGRPWPYLVGSVALLLALAAPALSLNTGFPDSSDNSTKLTDRRAYDLLADGFGPGANAPFVAVADLRAGSLQASDLRAVGARIASDAGVASVSPAQQNAAGDTAVFSVVPTTAAGDEATTQTLRRVRDLAPAAVSITGPTALTLDLDEKLSESLPVFVAAILAASILLLMLVFRSIVVPLKAAVMNLLSIGAAYGVVVAVFQWGWLSGLFGLDSTYRVASPFPVLFFAVLFGLSMDYEVFLVSRIREAYNATGNNVESVARGLAGTGRVITSGALIMMVVFLSFITDPSPFVKMIGLGLATAILIDATVVRMLLVPATMALMGRANWWLPTWLDRLLPHVSVEGDTERVIVLPGQALPVPVA